jgi:hypothetical protein
MVDRAIGVKHLATRVVTLRLSFLLQFMAEENRGHAWRVQAWNLLKYGRFQRPEDVLLVNLNEARIRTLAPFYVGALKTWATVNPRPLHSLSTVGELRRVPLWDSVFFNPHRSRNSLVFDTTWKNLKCEYIGDLLNENGEWKDVTDFSIEAVSTSTVRRLTVDLKKAKAFIDHCYPNQARMDAPKDIFFY